MLLCTACAQKQNGSNAQITFVHQTVTESSYYKRDTAAKNFVVQKNFVFFAYTLVGYKLHKVNKNFVFLSSLGQKAILLQVV